MSRAFAEISFTPSVLALQDQNGSAAGYSKFLKPEADRGDRIGPMEAEFISGRDGFYQATVSESGWPYVQLVAVWAASCAVPTRSAAEVGWAATPSRESRAGTPLVVPPGCCLAYDAINSIR